jgi:hypothetical protein
MFFLFEMIDLIESSVRMEKHTLERLTRDVIEPTAVLLLFRRLHSPTDRIEHRHRLPRVFQFQRYLRSVQRLYCLYTR